MVETCSRILIHDKMYYRMDEYVPHKHAGVIYAVKSKVVLDHYTKA